MTSERKKSQPVPWKWLGVGLLISVVGCIAALFFLNSYLSQTQPPTAALPQATLIILTAPPSPTIDVAGSTLLPTPIPTFTPIPTPDVAIAPPEISNQFYAVVANTDGLGVTVRGGPSIRNVALLVAEEGTILLILDGPEEGDGFAWWQVQLQDGTEGWVVEDFLEPAAAP